jgi:hypothetical protein
MTADHKSLEALLQQIDRIPQGSPHFDLWVPNQLLTSEGVASGGSEVRATGVTMAIILDRLLAEGFMPAGFTEGTGGRTYHYKREQISN